MIEVSLDSVGRAFLYLGVPFVLMIFYFQWRWAKTCDKNIQILKVGQGGGGSFELTPKTGGSVSIISPITNATRTWAINELATIDVLYPGVGFVPSFMQKTIRLAIVHEGDWEPLLNRSPHLLKVASPDMVGALTKIAGASENDTTKKAIEELLEGVSTAPTREMIASPAVLGNLIHEKISEFVATIGKDVFDPLKEVVKNLSKPVNPTIVYIGLGLVVILLAFLVIKVVPAVDGLENLSGESMNRLVDDVRLIKQSLGVK